MIARDQLRAFASRIERLDEEIKSLNGDKKEIYAEMKGQGFDVKAFKVAHRKYVANSTDPVGTQEADAMVDVYLAALQGPEKAETQSGANVAQARGHFAKPSRVRAHEVEKTEPHAVASRTGAAGSQELGTDSSVEPAASIQEPQPGEPPADVDPAVQPAGGSPVPTAPAGHQSDDMPEIPDFLRRDRATALEHFAGG